MVPAAVAASVTPARRQRAIAAYEKAQRMHAVLEAESDSKRSKQEYKKVIDAYYQVYLLNPAYSNAPVALTDTAELYREMGRTFSTDSYFLEAIKSYRYLNKEYPHNRLSHDALFTVGEVYRQELEDPDEARKAFQDFLAKYPKSDKAEQAQQILKDLDRQAAERTSSRAVASSPPPERALSRAAASASPAEKTSSRVVAPTPPEKASPRAAASAPPESAVEDQPVSGLRQVVAVRRWVGLNYLRIVIEVHGEVKFESSRLSRPDRIVIDLHDARLSSELVGKTFPVENGFLRQIRVAQFKADVTRVVLDVERIESYSIFSLPNPFRLVIDVEGVPQTQVAKASKPAVPEGSAGKNAQRTLSRSTSPAGTEAAVKPPPPAPTSTEAATPSTEQTGQSASTAATAATAPTKKQKETNETAAEETGPAIQPPIPGGPGSQTLTRALGLKIGRIVIDPGHGGHDTGTIGPTGLEEKEVVLDVGLKLRKLLEQNTACEVIMTRSDDTFIPLEERTAIANEKSADLFLSIHANASRDETARGIETYYLNFTSSPDALEVAARENASSQEAVHQLQDLIKKIALTEKIQESQDFAKQVQHEIYTRVTKASGAQRDRGIRKAPFVVLIGANMPSVLAEISFLTNPTDERLLRRSEYREKIAYALYEGILDYVKHLGEMRTAQRVESGQSSGATQPDF